MVNRYAGEAKISIGDDMFILKLTLGAIAEVEDRLGLKSLGDFSRLFSDNGISSRSLIAILTASLVAGGLDRHRAETVTAMLEPHHLPAILEGLTEAFTNAFHLEYPVTSDTTLGEENHTSPP